MKVLVATSIATLLLASTVAAHAMGGPTESNHGPPVTVTVSTPSTYTSGNSEAIPAFNYHDAVPVTSGVGPSHSHSLAPWDAAAALVTQTGGER